MYSEKKKSPPNDLLQADNVKKNLKVLTIRGGSITLGAQVLKFFLGLISTAILARLLTPGDHGLFFMVMPIVAFIMVFKDLGLSQATVQRENITHEQTSNLFWVNIFLSGVLALLTAALAPVIGWFYGRPELTGVSFALAAGFFISGLTIQHQALIRRQMRFHVLAGLEIIAATAGFIAGVVSALYGLRYWALVIRMLCIALVYEMGVWIACPWRPGLPRRHTGSFPMITFGANITGFNIINYLSVNMANILIGKIWGSAQLGFYGRARDLLLLPLQQINAPLSNVAISSLSRLTDEPERYRDVYRRILEKIVMISMPGIAFMIAAVDWIIAIVLGPQWTEAVRIFELLGIAALLLPVVNTSGWLFISQGHTNRMFKWGIIDGILTVASICIGLPWGVTGVAGSYMIGALCIRTPLLFWFAGREGPIRTGDFYRTIAYPLLISIGVLAVLKVFRYYVHLDMISGVVVTSILCASLVIVLYYIVPTTRRGLRDFWEIITVIYPRKKMPNNS